MENKLTQKLKEFSSSALVQGCGNAFECIKLSSVTVFRKENRAELVFIYQEEDEKTVIAAKQEIIGAVQRVLDTRLVFDIKFQKSCFFAATFISELKDFFQPYPSVLLGLTDQDINIENALGAYSIRISFSPDVCEYISTLNLVKKLKEYFSYKYLQTLNFDIVPKKNVVVAADNIERYIKKIESETPYLEKEGGRIITVQDKLLFIGGQIKEDAAYISDARIQEAGVHCGKVEELMLLTTKPKVEGDEGRKFYKFKLKDFTGSLSCLFFPSEKNEKAATELCDGKSVIISGKISEDNYDGGGKLMCMVRKIMFCSLPSTFTENRKMRKVADDYIAVTPQPFIKPLQSSLFESKKELPPLLKGKKYCVFDLETTGLDPKNNEIMEIGAVIIDDGEIKETFSSFVSISSTIPEKIIQLTGIVDSDLEGQPCVKDVLADFYKFSYGLTLVGQNVGFDYGFISEHGSKHFIYFDNERMDTMVLARKYLKNMKNFTLKSLVARLEVKNDDAHRALSDAVATAEVFIKLAYLAE